MTYIICKAKNEIASNEELPKFNLENWEIIESVNCRKNATHKNFNNIFSPIYQRLCDTHKNENECFRLWHFKSEEVNLFK